MQKCKPDKIFGFTFLRGICYTLCSKDIRGIKVKNKTKSITICAFFAALTGVLSQISIPLPFTPVPINLATISPLLAGILLGSKLGALSQLVYVLIGAIGIPVYANFTSGVGIVLGPTGGYILGYVIAAFIVGMISKKLDRKMSKSIISMVLGIAGCYFIGSIWFMWVTNSGIKETLLLCVVPFLIGDGLKIIAASFLGEKLHKFI